MVSLIRVRARHSGAHFLSSDNMDNEMDEPILTAQPDHEFTKLRTVPAFSFHLLVSTVITATGVGLALLWPDADRCKAYFVMVYLRVGFWLVSLVIHYVVKRQHELLRLRGYHDFHRATATHRQLPFCVVSLWTVTFLGLQTLMHQLYGDDFGEKCVVAGLLSPVIYVTAFATMETIVLAVVNGSYIQKVMRFNNERPLPDAMRGTEGTGGSVGLLNRHADVAELLEKQADLISYLKDHNLRLNQKLMQMNAQVRTVTMSGASQA